MFDGCLMQTYDFTKAPLKFLTQESCKAWLLVYQYLVPFNKITGEHFLNIVSNSLHSIITDVVVLFYVIDSDCKPVKIYFGLSHILKIATFDMLPPVVLKWGGRLCNNIQTTVHIGTLHGIQIQMFFAVGPQDYYCTTHHKGCFLSWNHA